MNSTPSAVPTAASRAPPWDVAALAPLLFFVSGSAGLLYQIAILRGMVEWFGSTAQATGAAVGAFLCALCIGSLVAMRLSDRVSAPLKAYAIAELVAAVGGLVSLWLWGKLRDLAQPTGEEAASALLSFRRFFLALAVLALPITALGATLPLLSRVRHFEMRRARAAGGLQVASTLGAVAGVLLATLYTLEHLGMSGTLRFAAALNLGVALCAGWLARQRNPPATGADSMNAGPNPPAADSASLRLTLACLWCSFLSGAQVVAMEVLLFRGLTQVSLGGLDSFGVMLAALMLASAAGSAFGVRRVRDPSQVRSAALSAQGWSCAAVLFGLWMLYRLAGAKDGSLLLIGRQSLTFTSRLLAEALIAVLVCAPVGWAGSLAFPAFAEVRPRAGLGFGTWVAALSALWTVGAAISGLLSPWLLAGLGLRQSLLWFSFLPVTGILALVVADPWFRSRASLRVLLPSLSAAVLFVVLPSAGAFVLRDPLRFYSAGSRTTVRLVAYEEDAVANLSVIELPDGDRVLKVNNHFALGGLGATDLEVMQGILPALLKGEPRRALALGVGAGATVGALRRYGIPEVDAVEIVPSISRLLPLFASVNGALLDDPGVRYLEADARTFVRGVPPESYDLIVGDLFFPWQAEAGFLFTREHFRQVQQALTPDGLFCQWLPAHQLRWEEIGIVGRTFSEVFDDATLWIARFEFLYPVLALVGSRARMTIDARRISDSTTQPLRADFLKRYGLDDVRRVLAHYIGDTFFFKDHFLGGDINTVDRPLVEFRASRRTESDGVIAIHNRDHLYEYHEDVTGRMSIEGLEPKERAVLQRELATASDIHWEILRAETLQMRADAAATLPKAQQVNDPEALEFEAFQRLGGLAQAHPEHSMVFEKLIDLFQRRLRQRAYANVVEGITSLLDSGKFSETGRLRNMRGMALLLAHCDLELAVQFQKPLDLAIKDLEAAVEDSPGLVEAEVNLGVALFLAERDEDAVSALIHARSRIKAPQRKEGAGLPLVPEAILMFLSGRQEEARIRMRTAPLVLPYVPSVWKRMTPGTD